MTRVMSIIFKMFFVWFPSQAFLKINHSTHGILKKRDLRQLLLQFVMPVSDEEFAKLWKM